MSVLGHTARLLISTADLRASALAWEAVGFQVQSNSETSIQLTDGQLLLTLREQEFFSPALAYGTSDIAAASTATIPGPDGKTLMYLHALPVTMAQVASGEQNRFLGYFDALVVQVGDVLNARRWAEELGFFVLEEFGGMYPQSDVTDGLSTLSFRKNEMVGRSLVYVTDIDEDLADDITTSLQEKLGDEVADSVAVFRDANNNVAMIRLLLPEGTRITIVQDV